MNRDEATRRIDILIQVHEEQLEDLQRVRKGLLAGDYDAGHGERELSQEIIICTRKMWPLTQKRREFDRRLFFPDDEPGRQLSSRLEQKIRPMYPDSMESAVLPAKTSDALTARPYRSHRRAPNQPVWPHERRARCRDLAAGEMTLTEVAKKYGVTKQTMGEFARKHSDEVEAIKQRLDDEFAGLWIAQKEARLAAYQDEYALALESRSASHHEWIRARTQILHTVAEELGQLPSRSQVTVIPVVHTLVGVNLDDLR